MGSYLPFFSVEVKHSYFSTGACPGLEFVPIPESKNFIRNSGLLIRYTQSGVRTFFDRADNEALRLFIEEPDEPKRLVFKVFNRQNLFRAFTELDEPEEDAVLYFDNQGGKFDAHNRYRMHEADYVSAEDFELLDSPRLAGILSRSDRLLKPVFIVAIQLQVKELQIPHAKSETAPPSYYINFRARETFWKYYLLGNMAKEKTFIVDLDSETEFEPAGQEFLPGNRTAVTFRSTNKIPLREYSGYRFQLKSKDPNGGKVLIRRLPVASADQYFREIVDGKKAIVSEIFINC